jgi:hypothetical protein
MADARSRRPGDQNSQLTKVLADAAAMREQIDALEGRVLRLESELAAVRATVAKRAAVMPPPLPAITVTRPSLQPRKSGGRRSIVDISEIAELVESIPPPPRAPRK